MVALITLLQVSTGLRAVYAVGLYRPHYESACEGAACRLHSLRAHVPSRCALGLVALAEAAAPYGDGDDHEDRRIA